MEDEFEEWLRKKEKRGKKKGTYRERVLSNQQEDWRRKKRKSIKKFSKERSKKEKIYKRESLKYLEENPCCEICGKRDNLSIHHKSGRGSSLCDKSKFMVLCLIGRCLDIRFPNSNHSHCGGCHGWVEANKKKSKEFGWIE